jgi:hypothetical protein
MGKRSPQMKPKSLARGIIPPRVPDEVLNRFTLGRIENEPNRIAHCVEWQCAKDKERVSYLEKVLAQHVFGTRYDCETRGDVS